MYYSNHSTVYSCKFKIPKTGMYELALFFYYRSSLSGNIALYKNGSLLKTFQMTDTTSAAFQSVEIQLSKGDVITSDFVDVSGAGGSYAGISLKLI